MKVVYKTIVDSILDAQRAALTNGREIKRIVLTESEWNEFARCLGELIGSSAEYNAKMYGFCDFYGVRLTKHE